MTFAYPIFGYFLMAISLVILMLFKLHRKKCDLLRTTWGVMVESQPTLGLKIRLILRRICLVVAILCFCIALARPQWGVQLEKREHIGLNIIFALDTSKSMLANDVRPNRLALAKMSILELLKSLSGNHVGLIAFAGNAFLQCPSTADYGAFKASLQALDTSILAKGGTDLSSSMELASKIFEPQAKYKQMLLLTDGENLSGDAIKMAQKMASMGIIVHTVGIGTPNGSPISITNSRGMNEYMKDSEGNVIITKLDEATLQAIAQTTHGFYVPLGNAGEGLQTIYETALKNLPKEKFESVEKMPIERYTWFAGIALLLLTLEPLIYSFKSLKHL